MAFLSIFSGPFYAQSLTINLAISTFVLAIICLHFLRIRLRSGLRSVPGPLLASITDLYRFFDSWGRKCHDTQVALHQKYGPFVRYGPNCVAISDPDAIPTIYSVNKGFLKSDFYSVFAVLAKGTMMEGMFDTTNEYYHRSMRKPVNNIYALSNILEYEPYVDSTSRAFISRLTSLYADKGVCCDLGKWLQWYAFDVIGEITYSRRLGFIDEGKDVDGIIKSISNQLDYATVVGQIPWLDNFLEKNPILHALKTYSAPIARFTLARMHERLAELDDEKAQVDRGETPSYMRKKDMLSKFLDVRNRDPEGVPEYFVISWANSNSFAGSDTTGITLRALFYYLLKNPKTMARLRSEVDSIDGLSYPVSWADTKKMPYLDACIKEALRIHPAVAIILERVVPKGGSEICGRFFEEGTKVGVNPWVAQRDKGVFGDDAEEWNPDRWFTSEERRKRMDRSILSFGGGSRICLGKHISLLEVHKLVPQLLKSFDMELTYPEREWELRNNLFSNQEGLLVNLKSRVPSC